MEHNENIIKEDSFSQICRNIYAGVISVAILAILVVFPLYYRDHYFDILESKYQFYYMTMISMFAVVLLLSLAFLIVDALEFKAEHAKTCIKKCSSAFPRDVRTAVDVCLIIFLVVAIISTCQSDYVYEAFWGNEGRFTGLFLHLIYIAGFFVISRLYRFKGWHLYIFLAVAMLPLLFGITDYFRLDLLGFKENVAAEDVDSFTSTFGNINTYVTYIGIVLGMFSALFVMEEKGWKAVLSFAGYMITFLALIMSNSENGIIAVGFIFAFLPLIAFQNLRGIERYLWLLSGFFAACEIVSRINALDIPVITLDGVCRMLSNFRFAFPSALLIGSVALLFHFFCRKDKGENVNNPGNEHQNGELGKKYVKIWAGFLIACFCVGIFVLYDANVAGHSERYGSLGTYLHFSDAWGNYRGMIWKIALESYAKQPFGHKLWGYGLDTFGLMTYDYRDITKSMNAQVYDSAHNEYLQYLVSVGPIGLLAYLGFLGTAIYIIVRRSREKKWGIAVASGVCCYLLQALVTINLPIVTPMMWTLLSMGVANMEKDEKRLQK